MARQLFFMFFVLRFYFLFFFIFCYFLFGQKNNNTTDFFKSFRKSGFLPAAMALRLQRQLARAYGTR